MPTTKRAAKPAPKKAAAKKIAKGASYSCEVCGLVVSVDTACGCIEACDIICCSEPMQEHKVKVKKAKT
jgi:hypothetical protein